MNNKTILLVIAIILVAILGILLYEANQDTPAEQAGETIEKVGEDLENKFKQ